MYEMVESTVYTIYTARIDIARSSVEKVNNQEIKPTMV